MQPTQVQSDVHFVREVIARSEQHRAPASIYLLWAALILVGFPMVDFAPRYVGLFWMIAGPLGGVISFLLGWRSSIREGTIRRSLGIRYALHWSGVMGAILLLTLYSVFSSRAVNYSFAHLILLILALAYFLAGVHLDRPLLWAGLLMAAGYVALIFVTTYTWTITGVVVAIALVLSAVFGGRKSAGSEG